MLASRARQLLARHRHVLNAAATSLDSIGTASTGQQQQQQRFYADNVGGTLPPAGQSAAAAAVGPRPMRPQAGPPRDNNQMRNSWASPPSARGGSRYPPRQATPRPGAFAAGARQDYGGEEYGEDDEDEDDDLPWWATSTPVADLDSDDIGLYFAVTRDEVPKEAMRSYHVDPLVAGDLVRPAAGCRAMQDEFEVTRMSLIMHREASQQLIDELTHLREKPSQRRILVEGREGSGKSMALLTLVCWARANGVLSLYIPCASATTSGGIFHRREQDGTYDTPEAARRALQSIQDAHEALLQGLESNEGKRLREAVRRGLEETQPSGPVDALLEVLQLMGEITEVKTLVAIDDYNSLYSYSGYHRFVHAHHRENVPVSELRAAAALRVLEGATCKPPANGLLVGTVTHSGDSLGAISGKLQIPRTNDTRMVTVERFEWDEMEAMAAYYCGIELIPDEDLTEETLRDALHMTAGSPRSFRESFAVLF